MRGYRTLILLASILAAAVISGACSRGGPESSLSSGNESRETRSDAGGGLVAFVKNQKLVDFPSRMIGNAFDQYPHLTKKEWREVPQKSGHITVVFSGWSPPGETSGSGRDADRPGKGIEVTFVIEPNGAFYVFMISLIEEGAGGSISRRPYPDNAAVLTRIYNDERIAF